MIFIRLISFLLLCAGIVLLLRITPEEITGDLLRLISPQASLKETVMAARGKKKTDRLAQSILHTRTALTVTGNADRFTAACAASLVLMVLGCIAAILIDNWFLIPVFAAAFAALPFLLARSAVRAYDKRLHEELETALSVVTTSYIRTDDIIAAVIFREPFLLLSYLTIFVLAILFTISLVFLIVPRGLKDTIRLSLRQRRSTKKNHKLHVFLGDNPAARMLARSIRDTAPEDELLFIHFPDPDEEAEGELSIGEMLHTMFSRRTERSLADILGYDHFMFIRGRLPEAACEAGFAQAVGVPILDSLLNSKRTHVYILSENEEHNFRFLQLLVAKKSILAKVYCFNSDVNNYTALYANVHPRVRLLNWQELIFTQVKRQEPELMPVEAAAIAHDAQGNSLGYTTEPFNAMIVGFGATGQEALRFIHEFGSFVGKDLRPQQNNYHVIDPHIEELKGEFLSRTPAFRYDANVTWTSYSTGSERFWLDYAMLLPNLNYVVVCIDTGHRNVEIAVRLLQDAARFGKDLSRFKILVKASVEDSQLPSMIAFYNRNFCPEGVSVIYPFGLPEKVWNLDVVTGRELKAEAIRNQSLRHSARIHIRRYPRSLYGTWHGTL